MEVITLESEAFRSLCKKIDDISEFINQNNHLAQEKDDEIWVDNSDASIFLKISLRTLQRLRSNDEISYSKIRGKIYYRMGDIRKLLEEKRIRCSREDFNNLVNRYKNA